jgi:glycosyltransferase domain-containing protein
MNLNKINNWFKNYTDKKKIYDLKNILDLTIVIFSFQRPECIVKSAAYWNNKPVKILFIDGSEKILNKDSRNIIKKLKNIYYFHLPNKSIPQRINFGINKSKTTYTMCQGDDDFYLFSGLIEAVKKLKKRKNIIACMGQSLGLDFINKKPYLFEYGKNLINYSVKDKNFYRRLDLAFRNYLPAAFYAVFKTKDLKNLWANIKTLSCQELYEYEHAFRTYLAGSLITTKKKYWVRSFHYKPKSGKIDGDRRLTFSKWLKSKKLKIERDSLVQRLSSIVQSKKSINNQDTRNLIHKTFDLIKNNKNSLYKNNSFIFRCLIVLKKILETFFFSKYLNKFKKTFYGLYLIEKINYLNRKKLNALEPFSKNEKNDVEKLLKFLKDCPI